MVVKSRREKVITLRLTPAEHEEFTRLAEQYGFNNMANFLQVAIRQGIVQIKQGLLANVSILDASRKLAKKLGNVTNRKHS